MKSTEFHGIIVTTTGTRTVMSKPRPFQASKKFIQHIQDNLGIPDGQAVAAADWVLNLMERYGARSAQPVFDMEGCGPKCSWCGCLWPMCGHYHMSEAIDEDEDES